MEFLENLHQYSDYGLLALRIALGIIFLVHGTMKWAMWKMQPSAQMSGGMLNMMRFLSIAEPLGGLAILTGFLTQLAAIGLSLVMLGALYFKITKWKVPFMSQNNTGWEFDLMNLAGLITLLLMGGGAYALDQYVALF